jgi:nucleoside 2-deoxyribosyltransferase
MKIYIASAMFNSSEKARITKVANLMRQMGHTVYVPHEFKIPNADSLSNEDWANEVFITDLYHLDEADAVYYFCEGMKGDIGAAWECGYAYAKGKKIFVDELGYTPEISLMVGQCSDTPISSYQS